MNIKNLSRIQKEELYIQKMEKLQRKWKNPIEKDDSDDLSTWTDQQLEDGLQNVLGQLKFEIVYPLITGIFSIVIVLFISWIVSKLSH